MADVKTFFMNGINISEDAKIFIEEDFPVLKDVKAWKSSICTKLISEIHDGMNEELALTVDNYSASMKSISGQALAEMVLIADDKNFVITEEFLSEIRIISALKKAKEIVITSDEYDESNFVKGFKENVKEMIWFLCVAAARQEKLKKEALEELKSVKCSNENMQNSNSIHDYSAMPPGWESHYDGPLERHEFLGFEKKTEETVEKNTNYKETDTSKTRKKCEGNCENCKCGNSCKNCEGCDTPKDDDSPYGIIGIYLG